MEQPRKSRSVTEWADAGFWAKVYVLLVLALTLSAICSFLVLEWRVGVVLLGALVLVYLVTLVEAAINRLVAAVSG
jgi:hypothetical protein